MNMNEMKYIFVIFISFYSVIHSITFVYSTTGMVHYHITGEIYLVCTYIYIYEEAAIYIYICKYNTLNTY